MNNYKKEMKNYVAGLEKSIRIEEIEIKSLTFQKQSIEEQLTIRKELLLNGKETLSLAIERISKIE